MSEKKVSIEVQVKVDQAKSQVESLSKSINTKLNDKKINLKVDTRQIMQSFTGINNQANKSANKIAQIFAKSFRSTGKKINKEMSGAMKEVVESSDSAGRKAGEAFAKSFNKAIKKLFAQIGSLISKAILGSINSSVSATKKLVSKITSTLSKAFKETYKLSIDANVNSSNSSSSSSMFSTAMVAKSISTIAEAAIKTSMPKEVGNVAATFASRLIESGNNLLTFGKVAYQAYSLVRDNWPKIVTRFNTIKPVIEKGLKAAMTSLSKGIDKMMGSSNPTISKLGKVFGALRDGILGLPEKFNILKSTIESAISTVSRFAKAIDGLNVIKSLEPFISGLIENLKKVGSAFSPYLEDAIKIVSDIFQTLSPVLKNVVGIVGDILVGLSPLLEVVNGLLTVVNLVVTGLEGLTSIIKEITSLLKDGLKSALNGFNSMLEKLGEKILGLFGFKEEPNSSGGKSEPSKPKGEKDAVYKGVIGGKSEPSKPKGKYGIDWAKGDEGNKPVNVEVELETNKSDLQEITNEVKGAVDKAGTKNIKLNIDTSDVKNLNNEIKEVGETTEQAMGDDSSIISKIKSIDEAIRVYTKFKGTIDTVRHPLKSLKEELIKKIVFKGAEDIEAKAKKAAKSFEELRVAVQKFKNAGEGQNKVSAGLNVVAKSAQFAMDKLKVVLKANTVGKLIEKMIAPAQKATKKLADKVPGGKDNINLFKGALSKLGLLFGGIGLFGITRDATNQAIKYEAALGQLNRRLGESASVLDRFASSKGLDLGLSRSQVAEYGNIFSVYVSQFESDAQTVADTTQSLLEAAAKTAQATGYDMMTVMDSFRSGLTGSQNELHIEIYENSFNCWNTLMGNQQLIA